MLLPKLCLLIPRMAPALTYAGLSTYPKLS